MYDFRVTGLALAHEGNSAGCHPILARFACTIGPLSFEGCTLKQKPDGEITASLPGPKNAASRSVIADSAFRQSLAQSALSVFHTLGGVVPPVPDDSAPTDAPALREVA